jgi:hypothetical protein
VGADFNRPGHQPDRLSWTIDANKDLRVHDLDGSVGVFVGGGMDMDGDNNDVRAGVVFRLRF